MASFNRPILTGDVPRDVAKIDAWMAETTDRLNYVISSMEKRIAALEKALAALEGNHND